ncbi:transposase [Leisingera aquaemixtae]|nr:transposase [Leisingera aquaemixtae]
MGNGNRPTPEFRREAVRLALTSGLTRREVADDLGIGLSTLTRWVRQDRDAELPARDRALSGYRLHRHPDGTWTAQTPCGPGAVERVSFRAAFHRGHKSFELPSFRLRR